MLVIAVENLSADLLSCGLNPHLAQEMEGLQIFCDEAVRFTHTFTPSTQSQAALASVLTARYPHEHNVWHNGDQHLSNQVKTVAEEAVERGYRTAFFAGGPPIWRRSGLSQGFELFEDNLRIDLSRLYRQASQTTRLFLSWLDREVGNDPFFSVLHLTDLQFPDVPTYSASGLARERSSQGQLIEISDALLGLVEGLKRKKRWHKTHVVLMGLNGGSEGPRRPGELPPYSLYSSEARVALFVKPAQRRREPGLEWKIDRNVSLVDVGATLYDFVKAVGPQPPLRSLEVVSLKNTLIRPQVDWDPDRFILLESAWPQWREFGSTRFALRSGEILILYEEPLKIYNSLLDRMEVMPLNVDEPRVSQIIQEAEKFFEDKGFEPWMSLDFSTLQKIEISASIWPEGRSDPFDRIDKIESLMEDRPWDSQILGWRADLALRQRDWEYFVTGKDFVESSWRYVAKRNLGQELKGFLLKGCAIWLDVDQAPKRRPTHQECEDRLFIDLLAWVMEEDAQKKLILQEVFLRGYLNFKLQRKVAEMSFANFLNWDVDLNVLRGPNLVDLYLALPERRRYAAIARNRVLSRSKR